MSKLQKITFLSFLLVFGSILALPYSAGAQISTAQRAAVNRAIIEAQIKVLLLKIELLRAQLTELRKAEAARATPTAAQVTTLNETARSATVNILCENTGLSPFRSISGSGVIIDPRGIIITNAHIGQYFLVKDHPFPNSMSCVIRTGSPATPAYYARLMYLPPAWVRANPETIKQVQSKGTGEDDFAFLMITGSVSGAPLPSSFPHIPPDESITLLPEAYPVLLTSYPGELVGSFIIQNSLGLVSALTTVSKGYYFESEPERTLDLLDVSGTIVSQGGSSGGAVIAQATGKLIGVISTSSEGSTTGERKLQAITLAHVNRRLYKYTGQNLSAFLAQGPEITAQNFERTDAPILRGILTR